MFHKLFGIVLLVVALGVSSGIAAQEGTPSAPSTAETSKSAKQAKAQGEAPGLSDKERKRRQQSLQQELKGAFRKWLEEDVGYIITDEERAVFKKLQNDEEREQFIEQFWTRRNPDPESTANDFKEEHYRRIAYANQHFPSGIPGWKTDRGRIYIMYGPADEIEAHPSGGHYERPIEEGGGSTSTYPFEQWRYRYIEGVGQNIVLEFVDPTMTGEYRMSMDPSEKDALLYVPGAGLSLMEQLGLASKVDRFTRTDGTHLPKRFIDSSPGAGYESTNSTEFSRLALFANIQKPPVIKYKDLEEVVTSNIRYNLLPFQVRADYVKVTDNTVLAAITVSLRNKELSFQDKSGVQHAQVNIFGRVTTITRRAVQTFEDNISLDIPQSLLSQTLDKPSVYWKAIPLQSGMGLYRLSLAMKDVNSGNMGTMEIRLEVPRYEEEKLATSSLILADLIEKVPSKKIGSGPFVIGGTKVRPAVGDSFTREQKLGIYMEVYNLKPDPAAGHKPAATIHYSLLKHNSAGGDKNHTSVLELDEDVSKLPEASPNQTILEKTMSLASLDPGRYTMKVTVTDTIGKRSIAPTADFTLQ